MQQTTTSDSIHLDRLRYGRFAIYMAMGLMTLTNAAMAQSTETVEPTQPHATETTPEASVETDSGHRGCPGCGRQGRGRGHGSCCQGAGQAAGGNGRGQGRARDGRQGQGHRGQASGGGRPEAQVIHFLIENHQSLQRTVENIPGGVLTRTISQDPEIIDAVRTHVRQMVDLIHGGGRIRNWDPLFREIFDHREAIDMQITDIEGGVEVRETSADENVAMLIQAHAVKVEEFVARGLEAYREETPLPDEYADASP